MYLEMTEREWVEYEVATIYYDYQVHPDAQKALDFLFDRVCQKLVEAEKAAK